MLSNTTPATTATITVPRQPTLAFFDLLARKCEFFKNQYRWSCDEVTAGRMTAEHQLVSLTRLWQEMLAPLDLPPLPKKFSC